jgi:hypothetical protein
MRKYRNGKQSREPRQLSKYSPEYIQYRGNRGGYSVKVGLCDITGDGDADTISVAWRNPANGKVENCTVSIPQSQAPTSGPNSLTATEAIPASGPNSLTATMQAQAPASGPSNLTANTYLAFGPTNMTTSGYTDSAGRAWFSSYNTSGYTLNIASDGTASLDKPDGTMETVSDSNDPVPGTTGTWTITSIFNYDYVGDGGDYVSSFNLVP